MGRTVLFSECIDFIGRSMICCRRWGSKFGQQISKPLPLVSFVGPLRSFGTGGGASKVGQQAMQAGTMRANGAVGGASKVGQRAL